MLKDSLKAQREELASQLSQRGTRKLTICRSHTIKERYKVESEFRRQHGVHLLENHPQIIAKIRQSPELGTLTEQEDFGVNDIDEQVTSHKKTILLRNIEL